jgi:hypothetical protein
VTTPITPPLTPPQLAVLQKPSEGAPPAEPHLPSTARGGSAAPPQSNGTGRGRLLDIVV